MPIRILLDGSQGITFDLHGIPLEFLLIYGDCNLIDMELIQISFRVARIPFRCHLVLQAFPVDLLYFSRTI